MPLQLDLKIYENIFDNMPLGLIILDQKKCICAWNHWLVDKTGHDENSVINKKLDDLYPEIKNERLNWAFEQVIDNECPQILSQVLNKYVIPIPIDSNIKHGISMMQQHVEILPLKINNEVFSLMIIQDVTHVVNQKNILMDMAKKLEDETYHDALTNIYNRRFLWESLNNEIEQAKREKTVIACCMYDIDFFKRINDNYGHEVGDKLLIQFVQLIQKALRSADIFVRHGGEEFITIMPNTNVKDACNQYYRVQKLLLEELPLRKKIGAITCSAGISIWDPSFPISADKLVGHADRALYQAKTNGRNRVCVYNEKTSQPL